MSPCRNTVRENEGEYVYQFSVGNTDGFLVFSRGIKWEHWPEMGLQYSYKNDRSSYSIISFNSFMTEVPII